MSRTVNHLKCFTISNRNIDRTLSFANFTNHFVDVTQYENHLISIIKNTVQVVAGEFNRTAINVRQFSYEKS